MEMDTNTLKKELSTLIVDRQNAQVTGVHIGNAMCPAQRDVFSTLKHVHNLCGEDEIEFI